MNEPTIPPDVARRLGYYVYLYVDPRNGRPFYVGKGRGRRVLAHLTEERSSQKRERLDELAGAGLQPRLEVLAHGLKDEETALRIEAAVIDLLGLGELTNQVRGWKSIQYGRMSLEQLNAYYAAEPVEITDPVLLIRVNRLYRHGMSAQELYEITRGVWRLGPRREKAALALAVFEGVVREVYEIESWHPAGTTLYETREIDSRDRWEFLGRVARRGVRKRYLGGDVTAYFKKGAQSPVKYVHC